MKRLVVDYGLIYNRIALLENDKLVEVHIENIYDQSLVGNIYLGKVANVIKTISAAFVDIGQPKNAYMALESDVKNGSEIFVQVKKDAVGEKGATVTTDISLSGHYVVLLPYQNHVMASKKIRSKEKSKALITAVQDSIGTYGAVIRTEAELVDVSLVQEELKSLICKWLDIEKNNRRIVKNRLVYSDYGFEALIKKEFLSQVDEIIVNDKSAYELFRNFKGLFYNEPFPIFEHFGVEKQILESLKREVRLHQGSYITIDETEAFTAVDVNSGQFVGSSNKEETFLQVNLAAGKAIAEQLRLRNISGIILIDFINMKEKSNYELLMASLKKQFRQDKCSPKIHGLTNLGLMEITRKKNRKSLKTQLLDTCEKCEGSGYQISNVFFYKKFVEKIKMLILHTNKKHFDVVLSKEMFHLLQQTIQNTTYLDFICDQLQVDIRYTIEEHLEPFQFKTTGQ